VKAFPLQDVESTSRPTSLLSGLPTGQSVDAALNQPVWYRIADPYEMQNRTNFGRQFSLNFGR